MKTRIKTHMYICTFCTHIHTYTHTYTYTHIHTHTHTHTHTQPEYATVDEIEPLQKPRAFSDGAIEPVNNNHK